jgi:asparagine synthetase B (glutamine-hydrolysing)
VASFMDHRKLFCEIFDLISHRIDNVVLGFRQLKSGVESHKDFQTKKIWIVVANGKIYMFKRFDFSLLVLNSCRFGGSCKVIVELVKSDLKIIEKYESMMSVILIDFLSR